MISVKNVLSENLPNLKFIRKGIMLFMRELLYEGDSKSFNQKYSHL